MHRRPAELSQGMRQRVGIARAFALAPKVLLLDEPFGMLDSLTRIELQEVLVDLWQKDRKTALMVTHDVDEALFLSDRIVMMTNGPAATVGEILEVRFPRPRVRARLLEDPEFYRLREQLIGFLEERAPISARHALPAAPPAAPAPPQRLSFSAARSPSCRDHPTSAEQRHSLHPYHHESNLAPSNSPPRCASAWPCSLRARRLRPILCAASVPAVPPVPGRPKRSPARRRSLHVTAWDIGVNVRLRYEDKDGAGFTYSGSKPRLSP